MRGCRSIFYEYLLLLGGAAFLGLAIYFIALAFRRGEISVVTPFRYTTLLWAGTAGYVAFGEIPNAWSLAGAALIVASGLYVLHRDAEPAGLRASLSVTAARRP